MDRGKAGSKRSLLVDGGGPLSVVVAGANVHDTKLLAVTLDSIVVERPEAGIQHLCLDKGYDNPTGDETVAAYGYWGHIRRIGEEKLDSWGRNATSPVAGWWSAPWPSCPSAGRSWCDTTRKQPITSV